MSIVAIPGYDVQKIGRNKYSIAVTNGNTGAVVVNKKQLKQIADIYGVQVKDKSKNKKIILGVAGGLLAAGAVAAGIIYRKNIGKVFKDVQNTKFGKVFNTVQAKAAEGLNNVRDAVSNGTKTAKEKGAKLYDKIADFAKKIWTAVRKFVTKGWEKVTNGFKNLFKRQPDNVRPRDPKGRFTSVNN